MIECRFFCSFGDMGQTAWLPGVPRADEIVVLNSSAYTVRSVVWIINGGIAVAHIDVEPTTYGPRVPFG